MFDHFNAIATIYDRALRLGDAAVLREHLALPVDGYILDAGGGTGRVAAALSGQAAGIIVTDFSAGMLAQAARKDGLLQVRAPVEQLPFASETFDRVLVVDAFHHFEDHRAAVAEMWRVLRPGGRLVIEEPNINAWGVKVVALAERLLFMRSRFFSPWDIAGMLQSVGGYVHIHSDHAFNAWITADKVKA